MAVRAPHLVFWLFVFLVLLLITACAGTPSSDIACPVTPETVSATQIQAEVGEAASQYQVGLWYRTGGCLKRDQAKPAEWFRRAAEQGHIDAQWELGHMYDYGYGIEQDDEEAVRWTRLAAEQRHSLAARWLGDQYANFFTNGSGLARDPDRAEYWYRRAFAGNALSQAALDRRLDALEKIRDPVAWERKQQRFVEESRQAAEDKRQAEERATQVRERRAREPIAFVWSPTRPAIMQEIPAKFRPHSSIARKNWVKRLSKKRAKALDKKTRVLKEPLHKSGRIKLGFKMIKIEAWNVSNSPAIACVSQHGD